MPAIFNLPDTIKIGIIAFIFIFIANRVLSRVGMESFKA